MPKDRIAMEMAPDIVADQLSMSVEGSSLDGMDRLHSERGLSDSKLDSEQGAGGETDEIRTDEKELSEGQQERSLQRNAAEGNAERALSDDTGAGRQENGSFDRADGERSGRGRADEAYRSDEVGRSDEQHTSTGGGQCVWDE